MTSRLQSFTDPVRRRTLVRVHQIPGSVKKHARLNCISHLLGLIPYEKALIPKRELAARLVADEEYDPPVGEKIAQKEVVEETEPAEKPD